MELHRERIIGKGAETVGSKSGVSRWQKRRSFMERETFLVVRKIPVGGRRLWVWSMVHTAIALGESFISPYFG